MSLREGSTLWAAFAQQTARDTAINPDNTPNVFALFPFSGAGGKLVRGSKGSGQLFGAEVYDERADNQHAEFSGVIEWRSPAPGRPGMCSLLNSFLSRSTSGIASFTIDGTNDQVYFDRSGGVGTPYTATIAHGTYLAAALATQIGTAMNAADNHTQSYAASYAAATGLWTVTNGAAFSLTLSSRTNAVWDTIGFASTSNTSSATSHVGDSVAGEGYQHVFTIPNSNRYNDSLIQKNQDKGLSIAEGRDLSYQWMRYMHFTQWSLGWAAGDFHSPKVTLALQGADLTDVAHSAGYIAPTGFPDPLFGTAAAFDPDGLLHLDMVIGGHTFQDLPARKIDWPLTVPNVLDWTAANRMPIRVKRSGGWTSGFSFSWLDEDEKADVTATYDLRSDFEAAIRTTSGTASISLLQNGATIRPGFSEYIWARIQAARPVGDTTPASKGSLEKPYKFTGQRARGVDQSGWQLLIQSTEYIADAT